MLSSGMPQAKKKYQFYFLGVHMNDSACQRPPHRRGLLKHVPVKAQR
jgi:hypothetical protein